MCMLYSVQLFVTSWIVAARLLCPWDFPSKNTVPIVHLHNREPDWAKSFKSYNKFLILKKSMSLYCPWNKQNQGFTKSNIVSLHRMHWIRGWEVRTEWKVWWEPELGWKLDMVISKIALKFWDHMISEIWGSSSGLIIIDEVDHW